MTLFSLVTTLLAFGLLAPTGTVYADHWIDGIIESAKAGYGTVIIENNSSVSTGGQTAASGQTVTTGDVSASSHTETRINANDSGGSVQVNIQKTVNGETVKESYEQEIAPNEPVHVEVNAKATSVRGETTSETSVELNGEAQQPQAETHENAPEDAGFEIATFFTASVPNFFKKVVGFFWSF